MIMLYSRPIFSIKGVKAYMGMNCKIYNIVLITKI